MWKKPCFEEQRVRCLACLRGWDLHLGKTGVALLLQTRFLLSFMFLILFFLNVLRFRHLDKNVFAVVCAFSVNHRGFCNLKFELPIDKICSEIVA